MAKWLDKYEQGGLVLKKKTKDNYGKKPNPNNVKASVGPDFVGMSNNTKGRNYSPAWGGQFQDGGAIDTNHNLYVGGQQMNFTNDADRNLYVGGEEVNFTDAPEFKHVTGFPNLDDTSSFEQSYTPIENGKKDQVQNVNNSVTNPAIPKDKKSQQFYNILDKYYNSPERTDAEKASYAAFQRINEAHGYAPVGFRSGNTSMINPFSGRLKLATGNGDINPADMMRLYMTEYGHYQQYNQNPKESGIKKTGRFLSNMTKDWGNMFKNLQGLKFKEAYLKNYFTPGTTEYEAHSINQPKLENEWAEHYGKELSKLRGKFQDGGTLLKKKIAMGGSIPGAVGFTYARTAGAAPSNGKYAKKTKASAQDGISKMNSKVKEGKDFLEQMANSPLFSERYANMTGKSLESIDKSEIDNYRKKLLNNLNTVNIGKPNEYPGGQDDGSIDITAGMYVPYPYDATQKPHTLYIRQGMEYQPTITHELSHASNMPGNMLANSPKFEYDPTLAGDQEEVYISGKNYYTDPTEMKARRDAIAQYMMKKGLWNPITEKFTGKHYDKLKEIEQDILKKLENNEPVDLEETDVFPQFNHLSEPYKKDETIRIFNSFVKNNKTDKNANKAQDGKTLEPVPLSEVKNENLVDFNTVDPAYFNILERDLKRANVDDFTNIKQNMAAYVNSPTYKRRLSSFISDPEEASEVRNARLNSLLNAKLKTNSVSPRGAYYSIQDNTVNLSDYTFNDTATLAHELGHSLNPHSFTRKISSFTKGELDRLNAPFTVDTLKEMYPLDSGIKWGYTPFQDEHYRPQNKTFLGKSQSAGETYGDLISLRQLLNENGITTEFGQDITPEMWEKALENDKIKGNPHFKRLQLKYKDEDIIKLNNEVAYNNNNNVPLTQAQNGKEMSFYQQGLDFTPKTISKNGSVIKDDMGQWAHPGEITEIDSNYITMEGVDYPVLGISDTGDTKLMQPGENYKFKGKKVTEFPMMKNGGWLNKYTPKAQTGITTSIGSGTTNPTVQLTTQEDVKKVKKKADDDTKAAFAAAAKRDRQNQAYISKDKSTPASRAADEQMLIDAYVAEAQRNSPLAQTFGSWAPGGTDVGTVQARQFSKTLPIVAGGSASLAVLPEVLAGLSANIGGIPGLTGANVLGGIATYQGLTDLPNTGKSLQTAYNDPNYDNIVNAVNDVAWSTLDLAPGALAVAKKIKPVLGPKKLFKKSLQSAETLETPKLPTLSIAEGNVLKNELPIKNQISRSEIDEIVKKESDWLNSDEYIRRRMANTGETKAQIKADVADYHKQMSNTSFSVEKLTGRKKDWDGFYRASQNNKKPIIVLNEKLNRDKALSVIDHEIKHAMGQTSNVKSTYKGYPTIKLGNWFQRNIAGIGKKADYIKYLNDPSEQQVRGLRLLDLIEKSEGIPRGTKLTGKNLMSFASKHASGTEGGKILSEIDDDVASFIQQVAKKYKKDVKYPSRKRLLDFLNQVYAVPAIGVAGAIGTGAINSDSKKEKNKNGGWLNKYK